MLAVFLTLVICHGLDRSTGFYGCIAAIICLQKNEKETIKKGVERLIGTLLGGMFGYCCLEVFVNVSNYHAFWYMFLAPLGLLAFIWIMNVINLKPSISIGCVVFLICVVNFNRTVVEIPAYVFNRVLDTMIGILMAIFVNLELKPMKEEK